MKHVLPLFPTNVLDEKMFHKNNEKLSISGGSKWPRRSSRKAALAALLAEAPAARVTPNETPGSRFEARASVRRTLPECATITGLTSDNRSPASPESALHLMDFAVGQAQMGSPSTRPGFSTTAGQIFGQLG